MQYECGESDALYVSDPVQPRLSAEIRRKFSALIPYDNIDDIFGIFLSLWLEIRCQDRPRRTSGPHTHRIQ